MRVTFDLDELARRLDAAMEQADANDDEIVRLTRTSWVMARSLVDAYRAMADGGDLFSCGECAGVDGEHEAGCPFASRSVESVNTGDYL